MTPSYLGNVSFSTVTMAVNSPQPTLLCVIIMCVFLSSLYYQYVPFLDFFILSSVIIVAPTRSALGRGVGRTWRLATEPPQHTHIHTLGGDPWPIFFRYPGTPISPGISIWERMVRS